jgi:hypothetical protein
MIVMLKNESQSPFELFRLPEEHKEKIEEWLAQDFRRRIDGLIARARCLFLVGPTRHGKNNCITLNKDHSNMS